MKKIIFLVLAGLSIFFYKENQGLVVRTFLFEDIAFLGVTPDGKISEDSAWANNYDSFMFMD